MEDDEQDSDEGRLHVGVEIADQDDVGGHQEEVVHGQADADEDLRAREKLDGFSFAVCY